MSHAYSQARDWAGRKHRRDERGSHESQERCKAWQSDGLVPSSGGAHQARSGADTCASVAVRPRPVDPARRFFSVHIFI